MALLLLHGLGNSAAHVREQLGSALPQQSEIIAPDVRAHGASTLIGESHDFGFDRLAAEIIDAVRSVDGDLEPLTIVGVSMGAALGLRVALSGQLSLARLVFVRPAFTATPLPPNLRAFPVMGELLLRYGPVEAERRFRTSSLYHSLTLVTHAGAAAALQQFRVPDAAARAIRLVEIPRNRAFRTLDELGAIDVPTTIIAAPRDPVHPVSIAELWHSGIRGSRLEVLPPRDEGMAAHLEALRGAVRAAAD